MSIQDVSNSDLLSRTEALVHDERRITLDVIRHLREIERRLLFAELGYSSLFDFAVRKLGYSSGAAFRRIEAMRLIRDLPEVEKKVASGELALSHASQVGIFIKGEGRKYSPAEKIALVQQVAGKPTREVEKILAARSSPTPAPIWIAGDEELRELVDQLKDAIAHPADVEPSDSTVLKKAARFFLEKSWKSAREETVTDYAPQPEPSSRADYPSQTVVFTSAPKSNETTQSANSRAGRYVRAQDRRALGRRARGRCEFIAAGGQRCPATRGLQIEHVVPHATGGGNTISNLQLFCPAHQRLRAVESYGVSKMQRYLRTLG